MATVKPLTDAEVDALLKSSPAKDPNAYTDQEMDALGAVPISREQVKARYLPGAGTAEGGGIMAAIGAGINQSALSMYNRAQEQRRLEEYQAMKPYQAELEKAGFSLGERPSPSPALRQYTPQTFGEKAGYTIANLLADLPIFALGGQLGGMVGAFGLHSGVKQGLSNMEQGKPAGEGLVTETLKGGTVGALAGLGGKIGGTSLGLPGKILGESAGLTGGGALVGHTPGVIDPTMPTLEDAVVNTLLVGGIHGLRALGRLRRQADAPGAQPPALPGPNMNVPRIELDPTYPRMIGTDIIPGREVPGAPVFTAGDVGVEGARRNVMDILAGVGAASREGVTAPSENIGPGRIVRGGEVPTNRTISPEPFPSERTANVPPEYSGPVDTSRTPDQVRADIPPSSMEQPSRQNLTQGRPVRMQARDPRVLAEEAQKVSDAIETAPEHLKPGLLARARALVAEIQVALENPVEAGFRGAEWYARNVLGVEESDLQGGVAKPRRMPRGKGRGQGPAPASIFSGEPPNPYKRYSEEGRKESGDNVRGWRFGKPVPGPALSSVMGNDQPSRVPSLEEGRKWIERDTTKDYLTKHFGIHSDARIQAKNDMQKIVDLRRSPADAERLMPFVNNFSTLQVPGEVTRLVNSKESLHKFIDEVFEAAAPPHRGPGIEADRLTLRAAVDALPDHFFDRGIHFRFDKQSADPYTQGSYMRNSPFGDFKAMITLFNARGPFVLEHEAGHHFWYRLMTPEQRDMAAKIYEKSSEYRRYVKSLVDPMADKNSWNQYSGRLTEWWAERMKDYLIRKEINVEPSLKPSVKYILQNLRKTLASIWASMRRTYRNKELKALLDEVYLGKNYSLSYENSAEMRVHNKARQEAGGIRQKVLQTEDPNLEEIYPNRVQGPAPASIFGGPEPIRRNMASPEGREIQDLFDAQWKERFRIPLNAQKLKDRALEAFSDVSAKARHIGDIAGVEGKKLRIYFDAIKGATGVADLRSNEALDRILPVHDWKSLHDLGNMVQARRSIYIREQGGHPNIKDPRNATSEKYKKWMEDFKQADPAGFKAAFEASDRYFEEMRKATIDRLRDMRIISDEQYKALKDAPYSPRQFYKYVDEESTYAFEGGKKITVTKSGIRKLEDGDITLLMHDPVLLFKDQVARVENIIARNQANRVLYEIAAKAPGNGMVRELKGNQEVPHGWQEINVLDKGRKKRLALHNDVAREWVTGDPAFDGYVASFLGWLSLAKPLRFGATGAANPLFALKNLFYDTIFTSTVSRDYSPHLPVYIGQRVSDLAAVAKDVWGAKPKGELRDFILEGGYMNFLAHQGQLRNFRGATWKRGNKVWDLINYTNTRSELWSRVATRHRALKSGKSGKEATWEAREILDFSRGGKLVKALDVGVPYLNARVQATRRYARAMKEDWRRTIYVTAQWMALSSLVMAYIAADDEKYEEYKKFSRYARNGNIIVPTFLPFTDKNGQERSAAVYIPMDQTMRPFASVARNLTLMAMGREADVKEVMESLESVLDYGPSTFLPPSLKAFIGYAANKDLWSMKDIWRGGEVTPDMEYTEDTPSSYVKVGEKTGMSPERLQYAMKSIFGSNNVILDIMGAGFDEVYKDKPKEKKAFLESLATGPLRQFIGMNNGYIPFADEIKEAKMEEGSRWAAQNMEFDKLVRAYYKNETPENSAAVFDYIGRQPYEDGERLMERFTSYRKIAGLKDRAWWNSLDAATPETAARLYHSRWSKAKEEEKKRLDDTAFGFFSPMRTRFWAEFWRLRNGAGATVK